ncbi:hypothetical protein AMAG_11808 [Allomyces macrogynus ATCC 38327]|uniref:Uncharacterized protein n=1 Tax=Allomyces macrogynus (strain ATCC 38327) TaxID=578462 RepID=A0A0L0SXP7_ALLM3|nr:hypothetical protein AMAG_11808 [Allomyces macrogynus ATCC 38327]|eukprot:KNE67338.1 hypothetical protein AMAG_11808 [Allomyces macrogynus ATCC 38327]
MKEFIRLYCALKFFEMELPDQPDYSYTSMLHMIAKMHDYWLWITTPMMLHTLFLDLAVKGMMAPLLPAISTLTFGLDMDVMQLMDQRMLEAEQNSEWSVHPALNACNPDQVLHMDCTQELQAFEDDVSVFQCMNPK